MKICESQNHSTLLDPSNISWWQDFFSFSLKYHDWANIFMNLHLSFLSHLCLFHDFSRLVSSSLHIFTNPFLHASTKMFHQILSVYISGGSPRLIIKVPVSSSNHKIRSNTVWFGCLHYFHDVFSRVFLDCLSVGFVISLDYIEVWNSYIKMGFFLMYLNHS